MEVGWILLKTCCATMMTGQPSMQQVHAIGDDDENDDDKMIMITIVIIMITIMIILKIWFWKFLYHWVIIFLFVLFWVFLSSTYAHLFCSSVFCQRVSQHKGKKKALINSVLTWLCRQWLCFTSLSVPSPGEGQTQVEKKTFRELRSAVEQYAAAMKAMGISKGDRVVGELGLFSRWALKWPVWGSWPPGWPSG